MSIVRPQPPYFPLVASLAVMVIMVGMIAGVPSANAANRTGKEVVEAVCIACHGDGKDGAPRIGNTADWAPRAKFGLDKLPRSAMDGVRKMPAHGGEVALSDLEMTRAIAYMVSGGRARDPDTTFGIVSHGTGEQIVAMACSHCHRDGNNGAPKIGDADAWLPRLQKGIDELVSSATHGHNKMPSRGGFANLSDVDIHAAVAFMATKARQQSKH